MRRRIALALVATLGACRAKDTPPGQPDPAPPDPAPPGPAQPPPPAGAAADWRVRCAAALRDADKVTPARRVLHVIEGCRPCGDWTPLLRWNTPAEAGGPTHDAIAAAMDACAGYCDADAKQRFLGALDDARGKTSRGPWKALGEACKDAVSAVPDTRYMSAPYFALDRIARAVATTPTLAALVSPALVLPLPAVSLTGAGFELPTSPVTRPEAGPIQLTVTLTELRYGTLAFARLDGGKVTIFAPASPAAPPPYPGTLADPRTLAGALDRSAGTDPTIRISVIAASGLPATRLVDALAAAGPRKLVLTVAAAGAPIGWTLPGTIPITLGVVEDRAGIVLTVDDSPDDAIKALKDTPADRLAARPTVVVGNQTTVAVVAKLLGALAFRDVPAATLKRKPTK